MMSPLARTASTCLLDTSTSIEDRQGKKIGTQRGTTGYLYCSDTVENGGFGEENVVAYDDAIAATQALNNGQVDCVVIDSAVADNLVATNPGLTTLDTEYTNEDYAIGVAKGNTALLDDINTALQELIDDGTVQSIIDKYIPVSYTNLDVYKRQRKRWSSTPPRAGPCCCRPTASRSRPPGPPKGSR